MESTAIQAECSFVEQGDRGVWYSVTSDSGSCITVSTEGSDYEFDTALAVYEGGCKNLTCVGNNDNRKECTSCRASMVTLNPHTPGKTYKILVTGRSESIGNYSLGITVSTAPFL